MSVWKKPLYHSTWDEIIQEGKPKEIETSRSIFQIRKQIFKNIKKIICELEINGRYIKP